MKLPDPTELDHPYGGEPYRVYFESQLREALASNEAVMRMALGALKQWEDAVTFTDRIKACNPTIAAIKALEDALGT